MSNSNLQTLFELSRLIKSLNEVEHNKLIKSMSTVESNTYEWIPKIELREDVYGVNLDLYHVYHKIYDGILSEQSASKLGALIGKLKDDSELGLYDDAPKFKYWIARTTSSTFIRLKSPNKHSLSWGFSFGK